ncbi:hypothetical protein VYU27_009781, partial [Nannochloropsis oceanica]
RYRQQEGARHLFSSSPSSTPPSSPSLPSSGPSSPSLPLQQLGIRCQFYCGCCQGMPCYYSSRGSPSDQTDEYIRYTPSTAVALVTSFALTPYQAFWHPQNPCYAPQRATLQFRWPCPSSLHPSLPSSLLSSSLPSPAASSSFLRSRMNNSQEEEEEEEGEGGKEGGKEGPGQVYWESEAFAVSRVMVEQRFTLSRPAFFLGGEIVLVLEGKQQRQTLSPDEEGAEEAYDFYYVCLSQVDVSGVPLPGLVFVREGGKKGGWEGGRLVSVEKAEDEGEGGKEQGEGGWKGGRKGGRKGGKKGGKEGPRTRPRPRRMSI